MNISKTDAQELLRLIHKDQGRHQPAFSREFALQVIVDLSNWFTSDKYFSSLWLERWTLETIEEVPSKPKSVTHYDDPF